MKTLYPEITPYHTFFLKTDSQHFVYVEQSGNPDGIPVVFLHGGPCSGTRPDHRRFFNPDLYRIILFDQRGCGLSLPFGELENNTTQDLIADMERIRQELGIDQWLVFGGSWGGALALLYAQQHKDRGVGFDHSCSIFGAAAGFGLVCPRRRRQDISRTMAALAGKYSGAGAGQVDAGAM